MIKETWKPVPVKKFAKYYKVSNSGKVLGLSRVLNYIDPRRGNRTSRISSERILKPQLHPKGYMFVGLHLDGKVKFYSVHRLVALAFIPKKRGKKYVNHKNFIRHDNRATNLEWVTASENNLHSSKSGRYHKDGKHWNSRLNRSDVIEIRKMAANGIIQQEIAKKFGVIRQNISKIIRNKTWSHVG